MSLKNSKIFAGGVLAVYLGLRVALDAKWRESTVYFSYLFEMLLISATLFVYREKPLFKKTSAKVICLLVLGGIVGGFGAHDLAVAMGLQIPFNFEGTEALFLLLLLGPVLEEFLFRFALWRPISVFSKSPGVVIGLTTALFASGHFMAYSYVPEELKSFIVYQTAYVSLLGVAAGFARHRFGMIAALTIHAAFNLGFFSGAKF